MGLGRLSSDLYSTIQPSDCSICAFSAADMLAIRSTSRRGVDRPVELLVVKIWRTSGTMPISASYVAVSVSLTVELCSAAMTSPAATSRSSALSGSVVNSWCSTSASFDTCGYRSSSNARCERSASGLVAEYARHVGVPSLHATGAPSTASAIAGIW